MSQAEPAYHSMGFAADHGALELKSFLLAHYRAKIPVALDLGANAEEGSVDYPDYAQRLVEAIKAGRCERGVLMCGSGIGMSIAANRYRGIRAALVWSVETARLAAEHNGAQILCLGARVLERTLALQCVEAWLASSFGGGRHTGRIAKLDQLGP